MSRNVADQEFGSDEEDDDFNPAPAQESDNEDANQDQVRLADAIVRMCYADRQDKDQESEPTSGARPRRR